MIGLIVLVMACVMIHEKAKQIGISATPYILAAIFLAIVPSLILQLVTGNSIVIVIISAVMSIALCFIPYNMLKSKAEEQKEESQSNS